MLVDIADWHRRGTRYNIRVDPADGLLYGGEAGVQLTWMDAKLDDWVVTPRIGKPVEINALWHNALLSLAGFADTLGYERDAADYRRAGRADAPRLRPLLERRDRLLLRRTGRSRRRGCQPAPQPVVRRVAAPPGR